MIIGTSRSKIVKLTITLTLSIPNYGHTDSEQEMPGYGNGVILLNVGMYFVVPAFGMMKLKNTKNRSIPQV